MQVQLNLNFLYLWCIKYEDYYRHEIIISIVYYIYYYFVSAALKYFLLDIADSATAVAVVHIHKVIRYYRIGHRWRVRFVSGQSIKNASLCMLSTRYPPTLRPQLPLQFFFRRTHNNKRAEQIRSTEYCTQCDAREYLLYYIILLCIEYQSR